MATETTSTSAASWRPDVNTFHASDVIPDALILQASTVSGVIEGDAPSLRVAYINDDDAAFYAEDAAIDEANPTLAEITLHTGKIAQLIRMSAEQYRQANTAEEISRSVARAVTKRANSAFLAQTAPVGPAVSPPAGLLNVPGVESGGEVYPDLDPLIDLIAELESNGATPSGIILDPTGWATLRKLKTGDNSNVSLLGAGVTDTERRLLDLPVLVSNAMTAGNGLIVDKSAIVSAVGPVRVATSEHAYFGNDGIGVRCTWRIGWNIVRPDRVGRFTVGATGGGSGSA